MAGDRQRGDDPAPDTVTTDPVADLDGIAGGGSEPTGPPVARFGELFGDGADPVRPAGGAVPRTALGRANQSDGAAPPDATAPFDETARPVGTEPAGRDDAGGPAGASGSPTGAPGVTALADLGRIGADDQPVAPVAEFAAGTQAVPGTDHAVGAPVADASAAPDAEPDPVARFDPGEVGTGRAVTVAELGPEVLGRRAARPGGTGAAGAGGSSDRSGAPRRRAGKKSRSGEGAGADPAGADPVDVDAACDPATGVTGRDGRVDRDGRGGTGNRARRRRHGAEPEADAIGSDRPADLAAYPTDAAELGSDDAEDPQASRAGAGRASGRGRAARRPGDREELDPGADPVAVAREICLRLLTDRARTRQELAQALQRRGVPDEAATSVLDRFDEIGLVDDAAFAGQWVRSRHTQRGLARRAIAVELRRKGVSDEDAGEALAEVDARSEEQRARELVERKLRSLAAGTAEQRAATGRRLVGMLARKGYGPGVAYRVVKEALAGCGAEADELGDGEVPED